MRSLNRASKLAALAVAAVLVLSMTACAVPASSDSSSSSSDSLTPEPSPQPQPTPSLTAPDREYVKGVTTDNEYINEFWGIKFVAPTKDMMMATREQMTDIIGFGTDAMGTDPKTLEQLQQQLEGYELCAVDMTTGSSLMIMSIELPMSGISAEIYIKGILESVGALGEGATVELENDGVPSKEMVADKEYTTVSYTIRGESVPDNCQTQRLLVDGKRALIISTTYPPAIEAAKAKVSELLAAVTPL